MMRASIKEYGPFALTDMLEKSCDRRTERQMERIQSCSSLQRGEHKEAQI